jgi:pyruvate dehydrogenase E1 component alpha subunit
MSKKPKIGHNSGQNSNKFLNNFSGAELLKFYEEMLLIRRFEEKAGQLYGMGLIAGFCHLYIGQEAISTGITAISR